MHSNKHLTNENNLALQSYWDEYYERHDFIISSPVDEIRKWIEEYVPRANGKTCFELGCFPARYLAVFGELGYELNGIDLTPRVNTDLPEWLVKCNYKVGNFENGDALNYKPAKKYDVVCSFGFIEHFKNWEEVFKIHLEMVSNGGLVVIETPNFRGFLQNIIHRIADKQNYKRHFIPAMNPSKWKQILEKNNFEIINYGYIGRFDYWTNDLPSGFFLKIFLKVIGKSKSLIRNIFSPGPSVSPYIGIIARKK